MYTVSSLIPFNLLIDTDMGVIKYIQFSKAYQESGNFHKGIMEAVDPKLNEFIQNLLVMRKFANPISIIMKPEKLITSDPDKLLKSLLENEEIYNKILKLSTPTAIFDMVCRSFFVSDTLKYTILCNSDKEMKFLKKKFKSRFETDKVPATIIVSKPENVDLKYIDAMYIKDVHDIDKYFTNKKLPSGKNIIVADYNFNNEYVPEKDEYLHMPLLNVCAKYSGTNEISFINVYPAYIYEANDAVG